MNLLVAHPSGQSRRHIAEVLQGRVAARYVRDLTGAYDAAEHAPPDLALVDEDLAVLPEFEVLLLLFRALRVPCRILVESEVAGRMTPDGVERVPIAGLPAALALRGAGQPAPAVAPRPTPAAPSGEGRGRVLLIGASTGGVDALIKVLSRLPVDCPPALIVQHTGGAFTPGLARLLDGIAAPRVLEAEDGRPLDRGEVLIAPGKERHLVLTGRDRPRAALREGPPFCAHRPSVDALFRSGVPFAPRISAAILTGMGRDGAEALLALRQAGADTIGQDEATSVVYGMPRVAHALGAVGRQLPIGAIGEALLSPLPAHRHPG